MAGRGPEIVPVHGAECEEKDFSVLDFSESALKNRLFGKIRANDKYVGVSDKALRLRFNNQWMSIENEIKANGADRDLYLRDMWIGMQAIDLVEGNSNWELDCKLYSLRNEVMGAGVILRGRNISKQDLEGFLKDKQRFLDPSPVVEDMVTSFTKLDIASEKIFEHKGAQEDKPVYDMTVEMKAELPADKSEPMPVAEKPVKRFDSLRKRVATAVGALAVAFMAWAQPVESKPIVEPTRPETLITPGSLPTKAEPVMLVPTQAATQVIDYHPEQILMPADESGEAQAQIPYIIRSSQGEILLDKEWNGKEWQPRSFTMRVDNLSNGNSTTAEITAMPERLATGLDIEVNNAFADPVNRYEARQVGTVVGTEIPGVYVIRVHSGIIEYRDTQTEVYLPGQQFNQLGRYSNARITLAQGENELGFNFVGSVVFEDSVYANPAKYFGQNENGMILRLSEVLPKDMYESLLEYYRQGKTVVVVHTCDETSTHNDTNDHFILTVSE